MQSQSACSRCYSSMNLSRTSSVYIYFKVDLTHPFSDTGSPQKNRLQNEDSGSADKPAATGTVRQRETNELKMKKKLKKNNNKQTKNLPFHDWFCHKMWQVEHCSSLNESIPPTRFIDACCQHSHNIQI